MYLSYQISKNPFSFSCSLRLLYTENHLACLSLLNIVFSECYTRRYTHTSHTDLRVFKFYTKNLLVLSRSSSTLVGYFDCLDLQSKFCQFFVKIRRVSTDSQCCVSWVYNLCFSCVLLDGIEPCSCSICPFLSRKNSGLLRCWV